MALDIFKETTQQKILDEVRLQSALVSILAHGYDIDSWAALQELADSGQASRFISIGDQMPGTWTDVEANTTYNAPWDVVDFRQITTPDGEKKNAIIMQMHYCTPYDMQFDAPEQVEADEATAQDGVYYYGYDGSAYSLLTLQTGDTIPYSNYTKVFKNSICDTTSNIVRYGYNRWRDSGMRQYLNSAERKNLWWTSTHLGDVAPSQLTTKAGFMSGLPSDMLAVVNPIAVTTALNTVTDGGTSTGGVDVTHDKFWEPSIEEMYGVPQLADVEGPYYPYWKAATGLDAPNNAANDGRKIYDMGATTTARNVRLRSAYRSTSALVWNCYNSGTLDSNTATNACRCAPACAIYKPS